MDNLNFESLEIYLLNNDCRERGSLIRLLEEFSFSELLEEREIATINNKGGRIICYNALGATLSNKECNQFVLDAIVKKIDIEKFLEKRKIVTINNKRETIICDNALEAIVSHEKCDCSILKPIIDKIDDILKHDKCNYSTLSLILERIEYIKKDPIQMLEEADYKYLKGVKQKIQNKIGELKKDSVHGLVHTLSRSLVELNRIMGNSQKMGL